MTGGGGEMAAAPGTIWQAELTFNHELVISRIRILDIKKAGKRS
jgi:hypothetical protein